MSIVEIKVYKAKNEYFAEFIRNGHKFTTNKFLSKTYAIREARKLHSYLVERENDHRIKMTKPANATALKRRTIPELIYMIHYNKIETDKPVEALTKRQLIEILTEKLLK